jgi:hypothetical protein
MIASTRRAMPPAGSPPAKKSGEGEHDDRGHNLPEA